MAEYIKRDALKKRFAKRLDWLKRDIHDEYSGALYDCCEVDIDLIDEIPAADVVPVVHGRWIHLKNGEVHCSVCNALTCVGSDLAEMTKDIFYCYNCGAKMDGGADHAVD